MTGPAPRCWPSSRRRDRADRAARAREAVRAEWYDALHAQRSAFEAEGLGYVLNAEARRRGISEWQLWTGPADLAERYGTDEFKDFIRRWPRVTLADYQRQRSTAGRIARAEWTERNDTHANAEGITDGHQHDAGGPRLAHHEPGPLRHQPLAAEAPAPGGRGLVLGGRRGTEHAEAGQHAEAGARRPGRPAQPAIRVTKGDVTMNAITETARDIETTARVAGYFDRARSAVAAARSGTIAAPPRPPARQQRARRAPWRCARPAGSRAASCST